MKPLLAHIYEPKRVSYPCFVQPKLNGVRALYQNGRFQSRDEIPFPPGLLNHLSKPLLDIFGPQVILDGELYKHGWPLQRINAAVTPVRQEPTSDTTQVQYHIFDSIDFNKPFIERVRYITKETPEIKQVPLVQVSSEQAANEWYAEWVRLGYEGMMFRLGACPYTIPKQKQEFWPLHNEIFCQSNRLKYLSDKDNRVWHLLKRKDWQDDEFICVGVEEGEGKYKGTLGSFTCCPEGIITRDYAFCVGSGITDAQRDFYWNHPPLGRKIKVKYLVLSSDGIPLNPTILAIL